MTKKANAPETSTVATETTEAPAVATPKLNADSFKAWKGNTTVRSADEEKAPKAVATLAPQGKRESVGYYHTRVLTHELTGASHSTPQANLDRIVGFLKGKGVKIARTVYVARNFELRFFRADAPRGEFIAINVEAAPNAKAAAKTLGI